MTQSSTVPQLHHWNGGWAQMVHVRQCGLLLLDGEKQCRTIYAPTDLEFATVYGNTYNSF